LRLLRDIFGVGDNSARALLHLCAAALVCFSEWELPPVYKIKTDEGSMTLVLSCMGVGFKNMAKGIA
jgi:hypothetical protein